ncbi:hypothetical protein [Salinispira pacifica]
MGEIMRFPGTGAAVLMLMLGATLLGCGNSKQVAELKTQEVAVTSGDSRPVDIVVRVGKGWNHRFRFGGILPVKAPPQLAIWTESQAGVYSDTLFVTQKFAKQRWGGGPTTETFRIEALPVWTHRYRAAGNAGPTQSSPLPDAVTGPTPTGSFRLRASVPSRERLVRFVVEVNLAYDNNDSFPENASAAHPGFNGVSGQPSVIYSGIVDVTKPGEYELVPTGHGHPAGADGRIYAGSENLTTVRELIASCTVTVH